MTNETIIIGCDEEETGLLNAMADKARRYILQFRWARRKFEVGFIWGIGKVLAVFLFKFPELIGSTDDELWVIVGDLPSAYMVVEPGDSPREAVEQYCQLMDDWCVAVETGADLNEVYPVQAAPTSENASLLRSRLAFVRRELLAQIPNQSVS